MLFKTFFRSKNYRHKGRRRYYIAPTLIKLQNKKTSLLRCHSRHSLTSLLSSSCKITNSNYFTSREALTRKNLLPSLLRSVMNRKLVPKQLFKKLKINKRRLFFKRTGATFNYQSSLNSFSVKRDIYSKKPLTRRVAIQKRLNFRRLSLNRTSQMRFDDLPSTLESKTNKFIRNKTLLLKAKKKYRWQWNRKRKPKVRMKLYRTLSKRIKRRSLLAKWSKTRRRIKKHALYHIKRVRKSYFYSHSLNLGFKFLRNTSHNLYLTNSLHVMTTAHNPTPTIFTWFASLYHYLTRMDQLFFKFSTVNGFQSTLSFTNSATSISLRTSPLFTTPTSYNLFFQHNLSNVNHALLSQTNDSIHNRVLNLSEYFYTKLHSRCWQDFFKPFRKQSRMLKTLTKLVRVPMKLKKVYYKRPKNKKIKLKKRFRMKRRFKVKLFFKKKHRNIWMNLQSQRSKSSLFKFLTSFSVNRSSTNKVSNTYESSVYSSSQLRSSLFSQKVLTNLVNSPVIQNNPSCVTYILDKHDIYTKDIIHISWDERPLSSKSLLLNNRVKETNTYSTLYDTLLNDKQLYTRNEQLNLPHTCSTRRVLAGELTSLVDHKIYLILNTAKNDLLSRYRSNINSTLIKDNTVNLYKKNFHLISRSVNDSGEFLSKLTLSPIFNNSFSDNILDTESNDLTYVKLNKLTAVNHLSLNYNNRLFLLYLLKFNNLALKWVLKDLYYSTERVGRFNMHLSSIVSDITKLTFNERKSSWKYSNLTPISWFNFKLQKRIFKIFSYNKFSLNVTMWYYHTLLKFIETCSGHKVFIKFNPFIINSLTFSDLARSVSWKARITGFQRLLGHRIFLPESLKVIHVALRSKDPVFFANWIKGMLGKMSFWRYNVFFRYLRYVMRYLFWVHFADLGFRGLKIRLKGKVSVAGNARTRSIKYRIGETSHATFDNRVVHDYSTINTFTGVLGFQIWFYF